MYDFDLNYRNSLFYPFNVLNITHLLMIQIF